MANPTRLGTVEDGESYLTDAGCTFLHEGGIDDNDVPGSSSHLTFRDERVPPRRGFAIPASAPIRTFEFHARTRADFGIVCPMWCRARPDRVCALRPGRISR